MVDPSTPTPTFGAKGSTGIFLAAALLVLLQGCGQADRSSLAAVIERIDSETIRRHVGALSHDSLRGRDTDDVGYVRARDYVAAEFQRLGLEPLEGSSYLQPFELVEVVADRGSRLTVGAETFTHPEVIVSPDWMGTSAGVAGDGVYVGHGLVTGEAGAGSTLVGKVVFVLAGVPEGRADDPEVAMRDRAEVELALRAGALAVVVLNPDGSDRAWAGQASPRRPVRALADGSTPTPRPAARVGPAASRALLERWQTDDVGPVTILPDHEIRRVRSWNVGGLWRGADPVKADEAVVFTAHLDHVGVGRPDPVGDSIYNGTHDNALGVAKVLAAAEALSGAGLDRTVLFLATGAEESGLLGSWHYVKNPTIPIDRIAAAINHDGGLVGGRHDDVFAWGPEFSTVEGDVEWAAAETGLGLSREKRPPFGPSAGLLYRSDHYPFLISGVPVVYLMPGFTIGGDPERGRRAWEEYLATVHHAQADNFDAAASYDSPVALTALSVRLAWRLANADAMPRTHADAPVSRTRGIPNGFFFGDSVPFPGSADAR